MIKTTTISIEEIVRDTAKKTEAKKFRGGLSEYIETLIKADLDKKKIALLVV
jgi:hypothetical protein